jgi:hypothetical protein
MMAAQIFSQYHFQRTVRFVIFTGEEQGLYGSGSYANKVATDGDNIVAVYNMDMIAWDNVGGPELMIYTRTASNPGYDGDMVIANTFVDAVNTYSLDTVLTPIIASDNEAWSDHASFWDEGFSAVCAIEDDGDFNDNYHTANDTISTLNFTYFTNFVKASIGTAAHLAQPAGCTENDTRPTSCGLGECTSCAGEATCINNEWVETTPCDPYCNASSETCNSLDDDCDGTADEGFDTPTTCGVGACAGNTGVIPCVGGPDTCDPFEGTIVEICGNLIDDDCDGTTDEPECELINIVLPANGGVLESFTSEYGGSYVASDLTNEVTNEAGWASVENPGSPQEFEYSFIDGNDAILAEAVIHGGTAEGSYYSKDVEVWTSANGTNYTFAGSDTLSDIDNDSVTIDLGNAVAKRVKLAITSGYRTDYWELAEFEVMGAVPEPGLLTQLVAGVFGLFMLNGYRKRGL